MEAPGRAAVSEAMMQALEDDTERPAQVPGSVRTA